MDKYSDEILDLLKLIDSVKAATTCNEIDLLGNEKTFAKLIKNRFPLNGFKCNISELFENSKTHVIPIKNDKPIKIIIEE